MRKTNLLFSIISSLIMTFHLSLISFAADDAITIHKTVEPTDENRVFEVTYSIESKPKQSEVDLLIVLDRSNSMLFLDDDRAPVAKSVRQQVIQFIKDVYEDRPNTRIGILSFGSDASKEHNWRYCNNKDDAISKVRYIYDYYWNGHKYKYDHFDYWSGATNIKAGFKLANQTILEDNKLNNNHSVDTIVLFTDGVATRGGTNQDENNNYPSSHNTNTNRAINAAKEAMKNAVVFTIGYFEGVSQSSTKAVAQDTLRQSQNGGYYDAGTLDQLSSILDSISQNLNYVGTNAILTETLNEAFEIVDGSLPEGVNAEVLTTENGQQQVKWHIGTLGEEIKQFKFKIRVKDDYYPTGMKHVAVSDENYLTYDDDVEHNQKKDIEDYYVDIPPLDNLPCVINDNYNDFTGYLVGDTAEITHTLEFTNHAPFKFKKIWMGTYTKKLMDAQLSDAFSISESSTWTIQDNTLNSTIQEEYVLPSSETWEKDIPLVLTCLKEGHYTFVHDLDYVLADLNEVLFDNKLENMAENIVRVRKGEVNITLIDHDLACGIANEAITITGDKTGYNQTIVTDSDGKIVVQLPTDDYTIRLSIPSGYGLREGQPGMTLNESKITINASLNYNSPVVDKTINFDAQTVRDIKVLTVNDKSETELDYDLHYNESDPFPVKVIFTTLNNFDTFSLVIEDDLPDIAGIGNVYKHDKTVNALDQLIDGFSINKISDDKYHIIYNGDSPLPAGDYEVLMTREIPKEGFDYNNDYRIGIEKANCNGNSENITSEEKLTISYIDNTPPTISISQEKNIFEQQTKVIVTIESEGAFISEHQCAQGSYNETTIKDATKTPLEEKEIDEKYSVKGYFTIIKSDEEETPFTIYAKDAAGNEVTEEIIVELPEALPDLT